MKMLYNVKRPSPENNMLMNQFFINAKQLTLQVKHEQDRLFKPFEMRARAGIIIVTLLLLIASNTFAQTGSVTGRVLDRNTGEGIPFATAALMAAQDESPLFGTTTDFDGNFTIQNVRAGDYQLSISFIGYTTYQTGLQIPAQQPHLYVGSLLLSPSTLNLDEVEVSAMAQTMSSGIDRRSYRAEDFETARGGTASDLLSRLPSVTVSPDGEISLRGTTDFIVYLNGRPTQIEPSVLLSQMSASSVVSIDVITVPTAAFDAQGKGGIINITTRSEELNGLSVSATGTLGGSPWGNRTEHFTGHKLKDDRYGAGINMVYANNGWTLHAGFNYSWRDANTSREGVARILERSTGAYKHMFASGLKPEWYENLSVHFGVDKKLSDKLALSTSYYHGKQTEGRTAYYLYHNFFGDINQQAIEGVAMEESWTLNPNTGIRKGEFHTANVDMNFKPSKRELWRVAALYEYSVLSHEIDNPNIEVINKQQALGSMISHYKQGDRTPLHGMRLSADYRIDLNNGYALGLGYHPQWFTIDGGFNYDTLNVSNNNWGVYSSLENEVELERWIQAAYADFSGQMHKLSFKAGLRMEYTKQDLHIGNPQYFSLIDRPPTNTYSLDQVDWFPSFHASYPVAERDKLTFAASRRISRAPLKNMAPFLYRRHLEVYVVGDPELKPEYIHTIELSYTKGIGNQQFNLTGFYRGVENAIFRVNTVFEEELILIRSFTNAGKTTAMGAELNTNLAIGQKFKFFVGASLYNYHIQADIFGFREDNQSTNWSLKGNAHLAINRQIAFVADFNIRSAEVTAQGQDGLRAMANAALSYNPQKYRGLSINLRALNIFDSNNRHVSTRAFDPEGTQIFYQDTDYYWYGPIAEVGVSFNFNWKDQAKKGPVSSFGQDEF
jgi:outer membrane receptor protein involved in Fe transport